MYGILLAFTTIILWTGNVLLARVIGDTLPPLTLTVLRNIVAFLCVAPFAMPRIWRRRRELLARKRFYIYATLLGVILMNTPLYAAGRLTLALNMGLINVSSPVLILIMARIVLKEPIAFRTILSAAVCVFGIIYLMVGGDLERLLQLDLHMGDLFMLVTSVSFAAYTIFIRRNPINGNMVDFLAIIFGLSAVALAPFAVLESFYLPVVLGVPQVLAVLYAGIFAAIVSLWAWNLAVARIGPSKAGIIYYTFPLFVAAGAILLLGETLTRAHCLGGALIIGGVVLATLPRRV